jgi:hypothetical protein
MYGDDKTRDQSAEENDKKSIGHYDERKLAIIKKIPKIQLNQMGYGDLECLDKDEDFLSKSSLSDQDFELLMKDDFFDEVKRVQSDLAKLDEEVQKDKSEEKPQRKDSHEDSLNSVSTGPNSLCMPKFDPTLDYHNEFYKVFVQNQHTMSEIEQAANDRNDNLMQIMKISEFYDQNVERFKAERYATGRKIHERKKMNQLERGQECPYDNCCKIYASEGALNNHIKIKHNGGNKTDREKLAKSLVFCTARGIGINEKLEVNLPPGIVYEAAIELKQTTDIHINDKDL